MANGTGITILRTPVRAPNANAVCERFLRSVRAECLDHMLILDADHRPSILRHFDHASRPRATPPDAT